MTKLSGYFPGINMLETSANKSEHIKSDALARSLIYTTRKDIVHLERTMETVVYGILINWKWLGTNHKLKVVFNATLV